MEEKMNCNERIKAFILSRKAGILVIVVAHSERVVHYVVVANLIDQLVEDWNEKPFNAATTVNLFMGMAAVMSIIASLLVDTRLHRYGTVLLSIAAHLTGLGFLMLWSVRNFSEKANAGHPSALFYVALNIMAVGMGGLQTTLKAYAAQQFTRVARRIGSEVEDRILFKIWYYILWWIGTIEGLLLVVVLNWYITNRIDGTMRHKVNLVFCYGISAGFMFVAFVLFSSGTRLYEETPPDESRLKHMLRVIVAATRKSHLTLSSNPNELYRGDDEHSIPHTSRLRWLDKAAMIEETPPAGSSPDPWRLCTVTDVVITKKVFLTLPIWPSFIVYGMVMSMEITYFLLQAMNMDRKLVGSLNFPLGLLVASASLSSFLIKHLFLEGSKKFNKTKQSKHKYGISATKRIGVGMIFSILCCTTAALVEFERLKGLKQIPKKQMRFFWLLPQYFFIGAMDAFARKGLKDLFNEQFPETKMKFGRTLPENVIGLACFCTVLFALVTEKISEIGGKMRHGWISDAVDDGHLDYFYWTLASLSFINLCFYGYFWRKYTLSQKHPRKEESAATNIFHQKHAL